MKKAGTYLNVHKNSGGEIQTEDLITLKDLIEGGELRSVIDRHYSLEQIVEAYRYIESGHKKGNVVLTIEYEAKT